MTAVARIVLGDSTRRVAAALPDDRQWLLAAEPALPVQAAWLAWRSLCERSNDLLDLARARDRLLERMAFDGLDVRRDLPAFLRPTLRKTGPAAERFRGHLGTVRAAIREWILREAGNRLSPATTANAVYADMLLAVTEAIRIGPENALPIVEHGVGALPAQDPVHEWLCDALRSRIASATDASENHSQLTELLQRRLDSEAMLRATFGPHKLKAGFLIDQFRKNIAILDRELDRRPQKPSFEGDSEGAALQRWLAAPKDAPPAPPGAKRLSERLALPAAGQSRPLIEAILRSQFSRASQWVEEALTAAESFLDQSPEPSEALSLIDAALGAIVRHDRLETVPGWVRRLLKGFDRCLDRKLNPQELEPISRILDKAARTLRRCGLPDRTRDLVRSALEAIDRRATRPIAPIRGGSRMPPLDEPASEQERTASALILRLSLSTAIADVEGAEEVKRSIDLGIALLDIAPASGHDIVRPIYRQAVARALCNGIGSLPEEAAMSGFVRLFSRLHGVARATSTDSHFSLPLLAVVDAAAVAIARNDFDVDPELRRLLDDAEFTIRRRIHDDYVRRTSGSP